jgi:S-formylglutathione hydrolase FrmB
VAIFATPPSSLTWRAPWGWASLLVDKNYRTLTGRDNRAIAALCMGGGQAFTIGLQNLDRFAWVGEFSSGVLSDADFRIEKYVPGLIEDVQGLNQRLRLLSQLRQ